MMDKNTELYDFQNGMIYSLATLDWNNAKEFKPPEVRTEFLELRNDHLYPINYDCYNNSHRCRKRWYPMYQVQVTETTPDFINYYECNSNFDLYISHDKIRLGDKYAFDSYALIPLNFINELYNKLTIVFSVDVVGYVASVQYLGIGIVNSDSNGNVIFKDEEKKQIFQNGEYTLTFDISKLETMDYLSIYCGFLCWTILEMRLE